MAEWYWPGLLFAAIAQIADGVYLYRARGRINTGSVAVSFIEFAWLLVSVFALVTGRLTGAAFLAAVLYVSYNLASMVQGSMMLKGMTDVKTFIVPQWMVLLSIAVGAAFAVAAIAHL
ncbi:MAG: hypothetical protein AAFN78_05240 [Pseudomonadota bacterium]